VNVNHSMRATALRPSRPPVRHHPGVTKPPGPGLESVLPPGELTHQARWQDPNSYLYLDPAWKPVPFSIDLTTTRESLTHGRGGGVVTQGKPPRTDGAEQAGGGDAGCHQGGGLVRAGRSGLERAASSRGHRDHEGEDPAEPGWEDRQRPVPALPQPLHGGGRRGSPDSRRLVCGTRGDRYTDLEGDIWCGSWVAAGWRPGSRMAEMPEHVRWVGRAGRFWLLSGGSRVDVVGLPGGLSRTPSAAAAAASGRRSLPRAPGLPVPALGPRWPAWSRAAAAGRGRVRVDAGCWHTAVSCRASSRVGGR
jgi:hypothetical protein